MVAGQFVQYLGQRPVIHHQLMAAPALLHALRALPADDRSQALAILALPRPDGATPGVATRGEEEVRCLLALVVGRNAESLRYARQVARRHAERARSIFARNLARMGDSVHRRFLNALIHFVIHRTH